MSSDDGNAEDIALAEESSLVRKLIANSSAAAKLAARDEVLSTYRPVRSKPTAVGRPKADTHPVVCTPRIV